MKNILASVLTILLLACTAEHNIDLPTEEAKLVVNGLYNASGEWKVELSQSQPYQSSSPFQPVTTARISIFEEGKLLSSLIHTNNGIYTGQSTPLIAGKNYSIEAIHGRRKATASNTLPLPFKLLAANIVHNQLVIDKRGNPFHNQTTVTLSIDDKPGEINYYHIFAIDPSGSSIQLRSNSTLLDNIDYRQGFFFSDNDFKDEAGNFVLYFNTSNTSSNGRKLTVHVRNITHDYYKYLFSQSFYIDHQNLLPVAPFSNVMEGYGIFAAYSEVVVEIE